MEKRQFTKMGLVICASALFVSLSAVAADLAEASSVVADVGVKVTLANSELAAVAASTNSTLEEVGAAQKCANVVAQAMAEAMVAFDDLEAGNEDAAPQLAAAQKKAADALKGIYSDETMSDHEKWVLAQKGAGGGPGRAYDPPNIYDVPWQTQGLRSFYQGLFGNLWGSSSFGGGRDHDATPE